MKNHRNILHGPPFVFEFPNGTTVGQLLFDQIASADEQIAQIQKETGQELKFKDILEKSCKLAVYLRNNGIQVNDRISICSENNLGWSNTICATLFVGATICPLNPMYSEREFLHAINITKPKILFVSPAVFTSVNSYIRKLNWRPIVILLFNDPSINNISINDLITNISNKDIADFHLTKVDVNSHIVSILCSSGTTGLPKGVMLSDKNYLTNIQTMMDGTFGLSSSSQVLICLLPFFHAYCFTVLIMGLIAGATGIVFSHFEEEAFLETIQQYKIEVLTLVPPLMVFLAKHPLVDKYDLSSIKIIWCGAAPLSRNIEETIKKRLKNIEIRQAYGMTETTLSVTKIPENCGKLGSVGKLLPGVSAKVVAVDEIGAVSAEPMGPNCRGELCFKGDIIMKGYCGDVSSTSATIDEDGWLHTGDIGYYDNDGYFYIVDRLKELIKYKGFQVPPAELEAILLSNPNIKDAAVVGLPDEKAGELPIAFIVKQPNSTITAKEVQQYVNERVSNQKRLRGGVRFLDNIPKNPSGKILRRELRALLKSKL
ncbi:uncharacterized protein LOC131673735 [Phymastichus coffea]|uniref:uncharacterized protein LOC131673735 n=1 Tax=Phymastichus coffea TaxID=108790 RepID=UPI00273CACD5|nr:uncharacterized protein LOC131673735 [Phymastichus coffea]